MDMSKQALLDFLDYMAEKGLANKTTIQSRKAAVNNVLGILGDDETGNVTEMDLDSIMERFMNLEGSKYKPESLAVYKSRVRSAIDDFVSYKENPMGFKTNSTYKNKKSENTKKTNQSRDIHKTPTKVDNTPSNRTVISENIIPIPIRENLVVRIQGLPFDLTEAEARKISGVINAMAVSNGVF